MIVLLRHKTKFIKVCQVFKSNKVCLQTKNTNSYIIFVKASNDWQKARAKVLPCISVFFLLFSICWYVTVCEISLSTSLFVFLRTNIRPHSASLYRLNDLGDSTSQFFKYHHLESWSSLQHCRFFSSNGSFLELFTALHRQNFMNSRDELEISAMNFSRFLAW